VASTGSTNADLLARAGAGPGAGLGEGHVLVAEEQTAGRGRLGRSWSSGGPGASLTYSVLLRPAPVPAGRRGWLPLLAGVATVSAVRSVAGVGAELKWPNDVLVEGRKLAGILAEQSPDAAAVVIGTGLNVATPADALPVSAAGLPATSLSAERAGLAEGAVVSREALLLAILGELEHWYLAFRADPDPVRSGVLDAYRALSATLGRQVRVELPAGRALTGTARDIDPDGRLLVQETSAAGVTPVSAGDVVHLRS
jgi:BirA family transcriptional regulator, biotin operon repressor / biotin---[acetyl-CoA-carboxylase] ligase